MEEVAAAEKMLGSEDQALDAAMCFYKALKVYSQPRELIKIYEQTIPPVCVLFSFGLSSFFVYTPSIPSPSILNDNSPSASTHTRI